MRSIRAPVARLADWHLGVEFKRADAPKLTPSMSIALSDLRLERLYVVYPGTRRYSLRHDVEDDGLLLGRRRPVD